MKVGTDFTVGIKIDLYCKECQEELMGAIEEESFNSQENSLCLVVEPCPTCLNNEREEAYKEGKGEHT